MSEEETTSGEESRAPVEGFESPINLRYKFAAGKATSSFLRGMKEGKIIGHRSPATGMVIVPPRGSCTVTGVPTTEEVELKGTGTIKSFTIVHLPIPNSPLKPPMVIANVVLDGSDQSFIHLVGECKNEDVQIGMRLEAVWRDKSEWDYGMDNIAYFKPLDEPALDIEELEQKRIKDTEKYRNA